MIDFVVRSRSRGDSSLLLVKGKDKRPMTNAIAITVFALALIGVFPLNSQAVSINNITAVFQSNDCRECGGVQQTNLSVIVQHIKLAEFWFIPANSFLIPELSNLATIDQSNFCFACAGVGQSNSTAVIQNIHSPTFIPSPHTLPTIPGFSSTEIVNFVRAAQGNFCKECLGSDQLNFISITQTISLLGPLVLKSDGTPAGIPLSVLSNLATIDQDNFCFVCDGVSQSNVALVVQEIAPVPEPGTLLLFGSSLAALLAFGRKLTLRGAREP
jgi:PEP-CTERM motif-containing protein